MRIGDSFRVARSVASVSGASLSRRMRDLRRSPGRVLAVFDFRFDCCRSSLRGSGRGAPLLASTAMGSVSTQCVESSARCALRPRHAETRLTVGVGLHASQHRRPAPRSSPSLRFSKGHRPDMKGQRAIASRESLDSRSERTR